MIALVRRLCASVRAQTVVVAISFFTQVRRDVRMQLAWLQLAAGLVHSSLLTEYRHGAAGHVVWSGMAATAILFIVSVLVLVERSRSRASSSLRSGWPHPRTAVCYAALVLHVIAPWTLHLNPGVR